MKFQTALLALTVYSAQASEHITTTKVDAQVLVDTLFATEEDLMPSNAKLTGNEYCAAIFAYGQKSVPNGPAGQLDFPDEGIMISSGRPASMHIQTDTKESTSMRAFGDDDLANLVGGQTYDACVLEFDFECNRADCGISFEYLFGSDEYNSMVSRQWNDAFAWFLNGENIAVIPGTTDTPVSIDTINLSSHSDLYVNNDPSFPAFQSTGVPFPNFQADGFSKLLKAEGIANNGMNHMKLVIADRADNGFDSWALFKKKSFTLIPPPPPSGGAGAGGDPHFMRWAQTDRDSFHGECDLVVMHSDDFHNKAGLDFHIRTTIRHDLYSYIESAALRIGDNTVEIHNGHVMLDGVEYKDEDLPLEFGDDYKLSFDGVQFLKNGEPIRRKYRLRLDENTEIEFKYYKVMMTFKISEHDEFADATGMLGEYSTGAMLSRNGQTMDDFTEFGFEWQVGLEDPVLFSEYRAPQLPYERCRMPSRNANAATSRRRLRGENTQLHKDVQQACAHVAGNNFDLCVADVIMTGDIELANEW